MKHLRTSLIHSATAAAFALSLVLGALPVHAASANVSLSAGDLIKLPDDGNRATNVDEAIYYFGADGLRYVFPNSKTYFSWYSGFKGIKVVGLTQLGTIGIGGNVTYHPGFRMIKIDSDPKTYAVDQGGKRRWVKTEAAAIALYGTNWNKKIDDVADAFFSNYPEGADIETASDFNATTAMNDNPTISSNFNLSAPIEVTINTDGSFNPPLITVSVNRTVRFTNNTSGEYRLASDPHPTHDALPGFDSAFIPAGLNYVYKFKKVGTWGYHHHENPAQQGGVIVTQ